MRGLPDDWAVVVFMNVISASCQPSPVVKPNLLDVLNWLES